MAERPTSSNANRIARGAASTAPPDPACHGGCVGPPPCRGAVLGQRPMSEPLHSLVQLCNPMPGTAVSSWHDDPPSWAQDPLDRRRPEPNDLGDAAAVTSSLSRSEETPGIPPAGAHRPSTPQVLVATHTRVVPTPGHRQVSPPPHDIGETQNLAEEEPSPPCSPGSSTLASQEAEAMLVTPPRPPSIPRGLSSGSDSHLPPAPG